MWTPTYLKFTNFFSYKFAEVSLLDGLTIISAEMINDEEADSNGAGKSTIIEAISISLTGSTFKEVGNEDIIKQGEEKSTVELELKNPILGQTLLIRRELLMTSSNKVSLYLNGDKITDLTSVGAAQKKIYEFIGISKDDLFNFYIINDQTINLFFSNNDAKQKEIISRLANFDSLDKMIKKIETECSTINDDLLSKTSDLSSKESTMEYLKTRIEKRSKEIEIEMVSKRDKLLKDIKTKTDSITKLKSDLVSINQRFSMYTKSLEDIKAKITDLPDFSLEITRTRLDIFSNEQTLKSIKNELSRVEMLISKKVTCEKCKHEFFIGKDVDVKSVEISQKKMNNEIKKINDVINGKEAEITNLKKRQEEFDVNKTKIADLSSKLKILNNEERSLTEMMRFANEALQELQNTLSNLKTDSLNEINDLKSELASITSDVASLRIGVAETQEQLDAKNLLLDHLGKRGFKTYLANKSIKSIESNINIYLKKFQSKFNININGYKALKSGELREKIDIIIHGDASGSIRKFSKGQKSRLNICSVLALQNMINNSLQSRGLNFLAFDETFDGLDYKGQKFIMNVLRSTGIKTLLITHNKSVNLQNVNEIKIQYKNKTSFIV